MTGDTNNKQFIIGHHTTELFSHRKVKTNPTNHTTSSESEFQLYELSAPTPRRTIL